eukprot:TRINITY_DN4984_c0_g4_i2.p1 TRINITY_DN4984_c0_g4~~TRINITY_DN4984_c0_g4_i2.p1  ORF type:complete len:315 (+),score=58.80 TRINITY_DN4984_c0_g4_i2:50-994(+)
MARAWSDNELVACHEMKENDIINDGFSDGWFVVDMDSDSKLSAFVMSVSRSWSVKARVCDSAGFMERVQSVAEVVASAFGGAAACPEADALMKAIDTAHRNSALHHDFKGFDRELAKSAVRAIPRPAGRDMPLKPSCGCVPLGKYLNGGVSSDDSHIGDRRARALLFKYLCDKLSICKSSIVGAIGERQIPAVLNVVEIAGSLHLVDVFSCPGKLWILDKVAAALGMWDKAMHARSMADALAKQHGEAPKGTTWIPADGFEVMSSSGGGWVPVRSLLYAPMHNGSPEGSCFRVEYLSSSDDLCRKNLPSASNCG